MQRVRLAYDWIVLGQFGQKTSKSVFGRWSYVVGQGPTTNGQRLFSHVKPRRYPYVLDVPCQAQKHFQRQRHHGEQEKHHDGVLKQAHALVVLRVVAPEQGVEDKASEQVISSDDDGSENCFRQIGSDSKKIW